MLLKWAESCLETAIEFALSIGHTLRLRPSVVILRYLYVIPSPGCVIHSYLHFGEE